MANKERQKRSARQARAREREALEAAQSASMPEASQSVAKAESKETSSKGEKAKKEKNGPIARTHRYFHDVRVEMGRVVWPSRHELKNYSVAVIVMLIVFGIGVWAVDTGLVAMLVAFTKLRG